MMRPAETVLSDQVETWLITWFSKRGVAAKNIEADLSASYIEAGLVDSMGLIELIAALEQQFQVRFTEDHFQDSRFGTIQGLSQLVAGLAENKPDKDR